MYQQSVQDPDAFWGQQGKILDWIKPYTAVKNTSFAPGNITIRWFEDGTLNLAANCLDRHLHSRGDHPAIIWEGDDASESKTLTYPRVTPGSLSLCQRAAGARHEERRCGGYLYANGA